MGKHVDDHRIYFVVSDGRIRIECLTCKPEGGLYLDKAGSYYLKEILEIALKHHIDVGTAIDVKSVISELRCGHRAPHEEHSWQVATPIGVRGYICDGEWED